jgi:hypothetical protein
MGEVFSRNEGFTGFSFQIWGYVIFHTITMALGLVFFDLASKNKREVISANSPN